MKFLKSTLAMIALLAIASVNAKRTGTQGQSVNQPMVTEASIHAFVNNTIDADFIELEAAIYTNYDEQKACTLIKNIAQTIANKFPRNATAKQLFTSEMNEYLTDIQDDSNKTTMQNCVNNSATNMFAATRVSLKNMNRAQNRQKCRGGNCPYKK